MIIILKLLKDINLSLYKNRNNFLIYDFETKSTKELNDYIYLKKEYDEYNNYNKYRHWIQYLDLSKFSFLLPNHYKHKFLDNNLRSN